MGWTQREFETSVAALARMQAREAKQPHPGHDGPCYAMMFCPVLHEVLLSETPIVDTRAPCPRCGLINDHRYPCTDR